VRSSDVYVGLRESGGGRGYGEIVGPCERSCTRWRPVPIQLGEQLAERQRETRQHHAAVKRLLFAEQRGLADGREHFDGARLGVNKPHESDAGGEVLLPPCRANRRARR